MASAKSSNVSVEPFDGRGDFTLWQQRVKSVLTREGTIKALKVKVQRTEKMTDAEWAKPRKNDKPEKLSEEEWEDLKDMETSTICLCLANNTLREVLGLTDPVDIWDKLESRYKSKSLTSRLYLKKRLFGLQMVEEANFNGHLDEFNKITTELESIDVKIEEEDKALLLLASLPSSFDNIVTTLLFGKETLKFDEGMDFVVSEAREYGVRLILSFVNNWNDFGGKAQYVQWARDAGAPVYSDDDFFTHPVPIEYYKNHIQKIITRINTVTGIAYKDDSTIMAWELMNEPRCQEDYSGKTLNGWVQEIASHLSLWLMFLFPIAAGTLKNSPKMVGRDPTMPSFKLLSDSEDERASPQPPPKSKKSLIPPYDFGDSASGTDDTDPTWWYRKIYLGGDIFPSEDEGGSVESDGEDGESVTSAQILEMSDTEIILSEPYGDEAKALRYRQRLGGKLGKSKQKIGPLILLKSQNGVSGETDEAQMEFMDQWMTSHLEDAKTILKKPLVLAEFGKSSRDSGFSIKVRDSIYPQ
ncbi:unnamed protein product [Cuscuta campestris]|uniref:Mannan endo-1,4-beta-mannosidase n=1 Tax=Cuscuta campestris TaxID=132261 RepID=A0A484LLQ0_9ASTE|nr:unnamed protein product [Cuscuta campestris]